MTFYDRYLTECVLQNIEPCSQATAEKLGVTKATITKWKTNKNTPNGETVAKAARLLGVSTDYLLGLEDSRFIYVPVTENQSNEVYNLLSRKANEKGESEQFIAAQLKIKPNFFTRLKNGKGFGIPLYDMLLVADRLGVRHDIIQIISPDKRDSQLPDRYRINTFPVLSSGIRHPRNIISDNQLSSILNQLTVEEQELLQTFRTLDEPGKRNVRHIAKNELDRVNQYGLLEDKELSKEAK